ncbi:cysteine synthase [Desulfovibrio ferrophilus]|uniref:cysteine synthase n=2 Tax=Desulfovibrio ferrophilus TaxID=241368 RepID=A0A2Z6AUM6_9BACT|nr:cysteine synthase [Desulfovibrio ferrophilus]BBD06928.1 cysteine synthase [Desulfovibrio ferrophilus]
MIYDDISQLTGHTPLVRLNRITARSGVGILAKVEYFNPGGSIKDRVAAAMINAAEQRGELSPGKVIIEATSGNTGIGLAMACAVKGYRLKLLMPETASEERKRTMRAYGAEIVLTEGHMGTDGAIEEAYRLAREEPDRYVLMDQFNNPASIDAHYQGTAQEIWDQTDGQVTHVVAALGTSGTVMGLVKRLKELSPDVQVVAVEPYARHKIQGLKNMQESYPPGIFNKHMLDRIVRVEDEEAFDHCRRLAREEGLLVGMSSGAALVGALKVAEELDSGSVVVIFPDGGERYLSTPLFAPPDEQGVRIESASGGDAHLGAGTGQLCLYTVGPSLDRPDDPEFWRRLILLDVLARKLTRDGCEVRIAAGLADMDDRSMTAARAAHMPRAEFAAVVRDRIAAQAKLLGLGERVAFPLAGDCKVQSLELCEKLLSSGRAYEKLRSVYFDVLRDPDYGQVCNVDMDKLSLGKTVDLADYVKSNPQDFTLLKRATLQDIKDGEFWQTRWGNVRPSWFMQMAAAALCSVGSPTVFLGGESHRFPHMENLRAIWSVSGKASPGAWMASMPVIEPDAHGTKADDAFDQASLGGLFDAGYTPAAVRLWLSSASYHKTLDFSRSTLGMWSKNQRTVQDLAVSLAALPVTEGGGGIGPEVEQMLVDVKGAFRAALDDDLSLYAFWPELFSFCRGVKKLLGADRLSPDEITACRERLGDTDAVLGILDAGAMPVLQAAWPDEAARLVAERELARQGKDFERADVLRTRLIELGFRVEDSAQGARLYPNS